jgi:predicted negative regulator of RcsB-dependent stress response
MKEYFINNIDTILAYIFGAGGLFSAWKERKKHRVDLLTSIQEIYTHFLKDYDQKFVDMSKDIADLKTKHEKEIAELQVFWQRKYDALKSEFDKYKRTHP